MPRRHRIAIIVLTAIAILLISLHLFITQNAAYILKKIVSQVSEGKYELQTSSVKFSYFSETIRATRIKVIPISPSPDKQSYELNADTIRIELRSIWPLLLKRSLDIEDLELINPSVVIRGKNQKLQSLSQVEFNLHDNVVVIQQQISKMIREMRMENLRIENLSLRIYSDQDHFFQIDRVFLHINDLFANVNKMKEAENLELEGAIHLWLDKPNLVYPDSNLSVSLDHFDWQSQKHYLSMENIAFSWRQQREQLDSMNVQLHQVTFSQLQWAEWVQNGRLLFDSIAASAGQLYFQKLNTASKKDTAKRRGILYLISPITIKHFAIREIQSNILILANKSPVSAGLKGDSLKVEQLRVDITQKNPIQLTSLDLAVRAFTSSDKDEKWHSSFASFRISKNQVLLRDYVLQAKGASDPDKADMIHVPSLSMKGLSIPQLTEGKFVVKELTLENPFVQVSAGPGAKTSRTPYRPFRESLPFLDIQAIQVHGGTFVKRDEKTGSVLVEANGVYGNVFANKILRAVSLQEYPEASDLLGMKSLQLNLPDAQVFLDGVNLNPRVHLISADKVTVKLKKRKDEIEFRNIQIEVDSVNSLIKNQKSLFLERISIDSGTVDLDLIRKLIADKKKTARTRAPVFIKEFNLSNIRINIKKGDQRIKSYLKNLTLSNLQTENEDFKWDHGQATLAGTDISTETFTAKIPSIRLDNESASTFSNLLISFQKGGNKIEANVPQVAVKWPLHKSRIEAFHVPMIELQQPDISLGLSASQTDDPPHEKLSGKSSTSISILIDSIDIRQPRVHIDSKNQRGAVELTTQIHKLSLSATSLVKKPDSAAELTIGAIDFRAGQTSFVKQDSAHISFGALHTKISDLHKKSSGEPVYFTIHALGLDSLHFEQQKNGKRILVQSQQIGLTENTLIFVNKDSVLHTLYNSPSLTIAGTDLLLDNPKQTIRFQNIQADLPKRTLGLDSFSLTNKLARDSVFASQPVQKDYITITSGAMRATDVNLVRDGKDTGFSVAKMVLSNFFIKPERDMRRPPDSTYKPLLTGMIQKIPLRLTIDTLFLQQAKVVHNVIAAKSGEEGSIFFTDINGWIGGIKTFRIKPGDTLRIRVDSKLMGRGNLYMRFRESYTDSLSGFLITARMGKFWMPDLDPVLVPLTMIKITKGQIDTLWLQAHANDLLAFGSMQINYRKLHVEKLDNQQKKQGFISWLANIIVRTSNHKSGTIYVERLQEKAIFNYWGKIALSGLLTNIRVASNKKYKKKYEAALKKYQLPPHLLDEDY